MQQMSVITKTVITENHMFFVVDVSLGVIIYPVHYLGV
jgi:hypothetical protein